MSRERDLSKELDALKKDLERLRESVERRAWGNPHDFAHRALSTIEELRSYYGSGHQSIERIRELVERLRHTAAGRTGHPSAGAAFIYGLADLIEGVYLGNRYHQEVHAYAAKLKIEENRRAREEGRESDEE